MIHTLMAFDKVKHGPAAASCAVQKTKKHPNFQKNQNNPPIQWCDVHCPQAYPPPNPQQTMEKILLGGKWAQQVAKKHPKNTKKHPENTEKHQKTDLLNRLTRHPPKWPVAGVFVRPDSHIDGS